jgi:hypothetical protein
LDLSGSCEHGDEPLGSIKGREFLDQMTLKLVLASEGLCSMELVNCTTFKAAGIISNSEMD